MRKKTRRLAATFLAAAFLVSGCQKSASPAPPISLPIFFTCDTRGRLEPCGCFVGQFGGLTRLKTVLDGEPSGPVLRVDVGDAAAGSEDYDFIEYGYMLRAFAVMKYDAINIGAREAQFSAEQLQQLARTSSVSILSANLVDSATRKPLFNPYRIVERGVYHIGIIGVLDPQVLIEKPGPGLTVTDMHAAVARCLNDLRGKVDLIVLLAFTDEASLGQLAREFYECQVILGGKVSQSAQELQHQNRSLVYFVTNESRALGVLRLRLARGSPVQVEGNEIVLLHDHIPQAREFQEFMGSYRDQIRHARLAVDDPNALSADRVPGVRAAATYVGTPECAGCHKSAAAIWSKSGHGHAFGTLVERHADADPRCIGCHTVGFGNPSGYRRIMGTTNLVDVGCESCHGPGSLHVREKKGDASVNFHFRPLEAGDCRTCHRGEFSPPFDWNQFWPAIKHGKDKLATS